MNRGRGFAWFTATLVVAILAWLFTGEIDFPATSTFLFWAALLVGAELLPVTLGFGTVVTMTFPIDLAVEILFEPATAMLIVGASAVDPREFRREIPLWRAVFNRAQLMLAAGASSALVHTFSDDVFSFPSGILIIAAAAITHMFVNLGLVIMMANQDLRIPILDAGRRIVPRPIEGFFLSQAALAALGGVTAAAYEEIRAFVVAFLIPLLFARLSIIGARAQQELSEKVRKQQDALLEATGKVFEERERERKRIAADIHDSGLQILAATAYACENAIEFLSNGKLELARKSMVAATEALDRAVQELRSSLVDLRRSAVEAGSLMETIHSFADQMSTLWGAQIDIEGEITTEPPVPVALAAFQILQEGLTNAVKHANNNLITVRIIEDDGQVHLVVEDKGPGFDPAQEVGADHVGMRLMKERAASVGGRIELASQPGSGTRLEAILPGGIAQ